MPRPSQPDPHYTLVLPVDQSYGQYGVRHPDGGVTHRWNGKTARDRAVEHLKDLQARAKAWHGRQTARGVSAPPPSAYQLVWRPNNKTAWITATEGDTCSR